jgi:hypothetical protein
MTTQTEANCERPCQIVGVALKVFAYDGLIACVPGVADEAGFSRDDLCSSPDSADIEQCFKHGT